MDSPPRVGCIFFLPSKNGSKAISNRGGDPKVVIGLRALKFASLEHFRLQWTPDIGYRCRRCHLSRPCSAAPPASSSPMLGRAARSQQSRARMTAPSRSTPAKRSHRPTSALPRPVLDVTLCLRLRLAPPRHVRGRGHPKLGGEAHAGEWRCGAESSATRCEREEGHGENGCRVPCSSFASPVSHD
jgi:hypothetical protein